VLAVLTRIDPLTYGVDGVRTVLIGVTHFGVGADAAVLIGVAIALLSAVPGASQKSDLTAHGIRTFHQHEGILPVLPFVTCLRLSRSVRITREAATAEHTDRSCHHKRIQLLY